MSVTAVHEAPAAPRPPARRQIGAREALFWLLLPVVVLLGARTLVAEPFKIPSASMQPTLRAGDHVLVNKLAYRLGAPQAGDLAVFESPADGTVLVKRIVAFEGQRVEIRDGVLHVDRHPVREPYVDHDMVDGFFAGPYRVRAGTVFVLGDNRGDSEDSRDFGPVPHANLIGRADVRIAPLGRFGTF